MTSGMPVAENGFYFRIAYMWVLYIRAFVRVVCVQYVSDKYGMCHIY